MIKRWKTRDPKYGFNLSHGGSHTPHPKTNPWDRPEFRAAVTAGVSAKWQDPVYQATMSKISREVNSRPEVKAKISATFVGRPISQERKNRLSELKTGTKRSPELNAKLTLIQASPEYIAKQRTAQSGKKLSLETKRKIAASSKSSDPEMRARIAASLREHFARKRSVEISV